MLNCRVSDLEAALARFADEQGTFRRVAELAAEELRAICDQASLSCRASGREKDIRSYHAKVISKGYADPWADVTDKAGARLIFSTPSEVDSACAAIGRQLGSRVLRVEDKREVVVPERLGYSGIHMQISVPLDGEVFECEVQLRTAAPDLWSTMSHRALYKPVVELPPTLQHAAFRLVAIVELFDEELQRIAAQMEAVEGGLSGRLIPIVEGWYLQLAHAPSNRILGREILDAIEGAFTPDEVANYDDVLGAYVMAERHALTKAYENYGPHSAVAYLPNYILFSQAEGLAVMERLSQKRHLVAQCWRESGLPWVYLETLAGVSGAVLPEG